MATLASSRTGRQFQRYVKDCRQVVGCIPYRCREAEGELEVLLISSQKSPALFFPKGGWEIDERIEDAACREAHEEAGVVGIVQFPLGKWRYKSKSQDKYHKGYMFSLLVTEELDVWPEKNVRQRRWMSVSEAREALSPPWMKEVLDEFVHRLGQEQLGDKNLTPFRLQLLRIEELRMAQCAQMPPKEEEKKRKHCAYEFLRTEEPRVGVVAQTGEELDCCLVS